MIPVYKPETTPIARAELLMRVSDVAHGPGLKLLRAVLRDLDQAETLVTSYEIKEDQDREDKR